RGSYQDGLYDIAASEARSFLKTAGPHPARGEVNLILGYIEAKNGRDRRALEYFRDAARSDDPSIRLQAYYEAAGTAWRMADFSEAAAGYQAIVDENRDGAMERTARYWLMLSLYYAGRYEAVPAAVERLLSESDDLSGDQIIQAVYCRGDALYHLDRLDAARDDMLTVVESETEGLSADAAMVLARISIARSDMRTADLWASRRLDMGYDGSAHAIRSIFSIAGADWHGARFHLRAAARDETLPPEKTAALRRKAAIMETRILADAGETWWSPVFRWATEHPGALGFEEILAECSEQAGVHPLPLSMLAYLESLVPGNSGPMGLTMARICLASEDPEGAMRWLVTYYHSTGESPDTGTRILMARLLTAAGESDEAAGELARLESALTDVTGDWPLMMQRADLYYQSGMLQKPPLSTRKF
ncbi:MAG TPA: hypothetical protein PLV45_09225, partial [bacterium]|nr:hypothetical protein [bacterium]